MSTLTFADTHNMVAFLEKPAESDGFHEIIDFLNANQICYALTVNPTIYTSCIEQLWATVKVKTVNGERQLQALVDKKKVILTETSIRSDLHLEDASGIDCLPTAIIFEELARMDAKTTAWNEFSMFMNQQLGDMSHHKKIYVNPSHTKKIFANMKRKGKDFSGRVTPLFATMMVQANQEEGEDSDIPIDSQQTPITTQPSTSKPQKKQSKRKQTKNTKVPYTSDSTADVPNEEHVSTHSHDPLLSAREITNLKLRVKKLEKKAGLRSHKFKILYKVGVTRKVVSSDDEGLGAQEDASKQGKSRIEAIDKDAEVTLVETQRRDDENDDNLMFDTDVLEEQEKDVIEKEVSTADPVTTAGEVATTGNVEVTTVKAPTTTIDELTMAQTLIEIKAAKPKAVSSAATTTTTTTPKAKGVVVQEPSEFKTTSSSLQASQLPQAKDKGKGIMVEPKVPLKKKYQVAFDEEMARNIEARLQAELIEEERLARQKEEEANIALLESWDNTQSMIEANFELAQRL
ncbi:hypothetical protein Tco_0576647 [Tanacetum coccineum]